MSMSNDFNSEGQYHFCEPMTTATMSDEEAVREAWKQLDTCGPHWSHIRMFDAPDTTPPYSHICKSWSAARAYTEQVIEEARQMREEIEFLVDGSYPAVAGAVRHRIIIRLESLYAEHVRGLRPEVLK